MTKLRKRSVAIVIALVCLAGAGSIVCWILPVPDGQIAYETIKGQACLVNGLRTQCTFPNYDLRLPAGSTFLDIYERTGLLEIDGEESIILTEAALAHYLYPRWSPDRQWVAYTNVEHTDICLVRFEEMDDESCYQTGLKSVGDLSWSPDGKKIAFSVRQSDEAFTNGRSEQWTVYIFDLDSLVSSVLVTDAFDPSWSPDGQQVAFTSSVRDGNNEIYTINIDGSNLQRITNDPANDFAPAWSPDGEKIAFLSDRGPGSVRVALFDIYRKLRVYVIDAEGGSTRVLLSRPFDSIERFVWRE